MTEYTIKKYHEGFIEDQFRIGSEVTKDWLMFGQTSIEQLKNIYSQPEFDPETRLYCFKEDKMVSFLTGNIIEEEGKKIAFLRFPYALPEYEETEDLLIERFIEVAKKKGAEKLRAVATKSWGNSLDMAERWDFENKGDNFFLYHINLEDAELEIEITENIVPFDYEKDLPQMVDIFEKFYGFSEEATKRNFETIKESLNVIAHHVIREKDKVVGRCLVYTTADDKSMAYQSGIYAEKDEYIPQFQAFIFDQAKKADIKSIRMTFNAQQKEIIDKYADFGFQIKAKSSLFEKEI